MFKAGTAVADQALLSIFNFAIGVILVRLASKQQVSDYAQLSSLVLLSCAILGATINSPLTTLLPKLSISRQDGFARDALSLHFIGMMIVAVALVCVFTAFPEALAISTVGLMVVCVLVFAIAVAATREFIRNLLFAQLQSLAVFRLDVVYCLSSSVLLATLLLARTPTAVSVCFMTAIGGAIAVVPWWSKARMRPQFGRNALLASSTEIWPLAKWSLPATALSWVNVGFPLLSSHVIGAEGTAELVAARLFVAPIGPLYVAWNNIFRPRFAAMIGANRTREVRLQSIVSMASISCILAVYLIVVMAFYDWAEHGLLGRGYHNLQPLVMWWWFLALAGGIGGVGTGLLYAMGGFKAAFWSSCTGNLFSVPLMIWLGAGFGASGILGGLILGALISTTWTLVAAWTQLQQARAISAAPGVALQQANELLP